ncbi:hypothetical protein JHK84_034070 [Glycine max]|nr:hypothetical protein JHK85_034448 [Glycine max]KAG5140302.1 hypothetical protein JHK84_034070 [Glycine max]
MDLLLEWRKMPPLEPKFIIFSSFLTKLFFGSIKLVYQTTKKRANGPKCTVTGKRIQGGHRRTCIGVMPGKILGRGHAGDPASALLELLDPEQNANFLDHYLDVTIDLSKVVAIAGYITDEKMHIARDYLEKTIREACGIKPGQVEVSDAALLIMCGFINDY